MEIFYWVIGTAWAAGFLKQLAIVNGVMDKHKLSYPNDSVRRIMPVLLFFTWPYFYFYGQ